MNPASREHSRPAAVEADAASQRRYDHALALLLAHRGDPSAEVERLLADDPHFVFGHCLRAAIIVIADNITARSTMAASLAFIERAGPDPADPARRHAEAARAWLDGDPALALERYGALVTDRPRDILALAVAHALDFRLGRRRMLRDRIAQVLPAWEASAPGYASVLAMYAFGLEENGQYELAAAMARRALELEPMHPGAIHVVVHVMEMQGRNREGLAFLAATEPAWAEGTGFSVHLAWHRALFHLDADNERAALEVYDAHIANAGPSSNMSVLADGSALLWRLQLRSHDVGDRWGLLAGRWEMQPLVGARAFYVVHAMMAFVAAGRTAAAGRLFESLRHIDAGAVSMPEETLARPFCAALLAFGRGDYATCIEWLTRVRNIAYRCGGSLAQCDLIHLTFTEAALRARKAPLARSLVAERSARKPASRFNRLLQRRLAAAG
jgi:tetratricopeptide (TPR) repeat protein